MLAGQPALRGIRHLIQEEPDPHWILRASVLESLAVVEERGLVLELPCVFPRHLGDLPELAQRFPRLTIVIDHLGKPPLGTEHMGEWAASLRSAAELPNVCAKISGLTRCCRLRLGGSRPATRCRRGRRVLRPRPAHVRQRLAGRPAQRGLPTRVAPDSSARSPTSRGTPPRDAYWTDTPARLYRLAVAPEHVNASTGEPMVALTDQAIAKIKDLIMSGEFAADSKLPKEQELAQRLGLSRNSLREAVRALTLIGVLEPRVGDGTYVTSLEPELLLTGMGFVSDLVSGDTLLELHQVRRILEPVATGMAATRLTEDDYAALEVCLARMDAAETTQAFIAADEEFHRIIATASGNSTLASLIQHLSGGTLRARLWRSVTEQGAIETTKQRHRDIYDALREHDAERASAADLIHLSEGEQWLKHMLEADGVDTEMAGVRSDDS